MLKVVIVGCGKIADAHVLQIQRIKGCQIVGVCDSESLMAYQLSERFAVKRYFDDLPELLSETRPDVVHITTPPQTHFDIAKRCLEWGCHVYMEKPFTICEEEAQRLIALANAKGLKMTVGHDFQFTHVTRRMRALVQSGFLGSKPVHIESYNSFEFGQSGYAGALLNDKQYWERRLPGKLLHNNISHGIARIAEFLTSESPQVIALGFTSSFLKSIGEDEIIDELRVTIFDGERTTAYFTFSSQMRPALHEFRIFGSKNGLMLNQFQETLIKLRGSRFKLYAEHFIPPLITAQQYLGNVVTNLRTFWARDFHMKTGMKYLIESFYRSIEEGTPLPISYREILLTAKIMDTIFAQLSVQKEQLASVRGTEERRISCETAASGRPMGSPENRQIPLSVSPT
jgi:predicted dehydrogenase